MPQDELDVVVRLVLNSKIKVLGSNKGFQQDVSKGGLEISQPRISEMVEIVSEDG